MDYWKALNHLVTLMGEDFDIDSALMANSAFENIRDSKLTNMYSAYLVKEHPDYYFTVLPASSSGFELQLRKISDTTWGVRFPSPDEKGYITNYFTLHEQIRSMMVEVYKDLNQTTSTL